MTDYLVYDVFTDRAFGGNPLAIIPDARYLAEKDLQRIAREFNFSETTFVFPPNEGGDAHVRIFTPIMEIPFAGHPTIGTALALHSLGKVGTEMVLELGIGPIPVTITGTRARFVTKVPLQTWATNLGRAICGCCCRQYRPRGVLYPHRSARPGDRKPWFALCLGGIDR